MRGHSVPSSRPSGRPDRGAGPGAGDLVEAVARIEEHDGRDILRYGYGAVTAQLVAAGLVDEVRFWIHPVLEGAARGPRAGGPATATLRALPDRRVPWGARPIGTRR